MKRWMLLLVAFLCFGAAASAQAFNSAPTGDVFVGYSYYHFDAPGTFFAGPAILADMNGGSASLGVYPFAHLGVVADFGGYVSGANSELGNAYILTYMFGPRVIFRSGHFTPFAQFLVGGAQVNVSGVGTSLAWAGGLGLDFNVTPHFGIRLPQVEYVRTYFSDGAANVQDNIRASAGVVFRF
jgi:hypothetical protein